jgi:hypothetical protein
VREIDGLEVAVMESTNRQFGDRDWVLPGLIGGVFFAGLAVMLLTVGDRAMHVSTMLAFIGVMVWGVAGLFLLMFLPFLIFFGAMRARRLNRFFGMLLSILAGISYFVVSGVLMAHLSVAI